MARIYLKTYGCQMNERDSEQVVRALLARGHEMTSDEREADVVLLNTCSVRDQAEQKALGKMGMTAAGHRAERPGSPVVYGFLGCMAQARGAELLKDSPGVDLVVGTQKFHRVAEHVERALEAKRERARLEALEGLRRDDLRFSIVDTGEEAGSQETIRDHVLKPGQATAFVSIMQGCNMHCAFCIVPRTRGPERARRPEEIVAEVRDLVARGVREVTLLGQIVNLYGRHEFPKSADDGRSPFVQLLDAVHDIPGLERLRFTSPHPVGFRRDLVDAFARLPKLCEHVHFPLQSGSDRILRLMRRPYTAARYEKLVADLRAARPGLALTTDIIVGFPGETDEDYQATRALCERVGFNNAFVFRYSPRRETPAATMADQVPEAVKEARNQDLLAVINAGTRRTNAALVGRTVEVLCEGPSKNNPRRLAGRTRTNKVVVFESATPERHVGRLVDVRVRESSGFTLYGEVAADKTPFADAVDATTATTVGAFDTAGMPG